MNLEHKPVLLVGSYGSGKTTILSQIYDYLMNFASLETIDAQKEFMLRKLDLIDLNESEGNYFCVEPNKSVAVSLVERLRTLVQELDGIVAELDLENDLRKRLDKIFEEIEEINPNIKILILIDELELYLKSDKERKRRNHLSILRELIDYVQSNDSIKKVTKITSYYLKEDLQKNFSFKYNILI